MKQKILKRPSGTLSSSPHIYPKVDRDLQVMYQSTAEKMRRYLKPHLNNNTSKPGVNNNLSNGLHQESPAY